MNRSANRLILSLIALFLLILCVHPAASSEEPSKIAILPFTMNAEKDLTYLQEGLLDMLATRLYWKNKVEVIDKGLTKKAAQEYDAPLNLESAAMVGKTLKADYVLFGSLTVFGDSVSLDATMASLTKEAPPVTVFSQTEGMASVIPEINIFAQKVNAKMFGRAYPETAYAQAPPPPASAPVPASGSQYGEPKTQQVSSLNPSFVKYHQVDVQGASFWKSKRFKAEIRGMDLGDVTGDGQNELVILDRTKITVYAYRDGGLKKLASYESSDRHRFLNIEVEDINGAGRAQIFASRVRDTWVESVALQMEGGDLKPLVEKSSWFFRVLYWPGRGKILVGQEKMPGSIGGAGGLVKNYFAEGIFELSWDGSQYAKVGESLLDLPNVYVFNFAVGDLTGDNAPEVVMIDQSDRLRILDMSGEEIHRTSEYYGGTINFVVTNPDKHEDLMRDQLFIPARILITDLDGDGRKEIVINQNTSSTYRLTDRYQAFSSGKLVSLQWTGLGLEPLWESQKISGCLSDFQLKDFTHDGKPELVVALIQKRDASFFQKPKSLVVSYALSMKE